MQGSCTVQAIDIQDMKSFVDVSKIKQIPNLEPITISCHINYYMDTDTSTSRHPFLTTPTVETDIV